MVEPVHPIFNGPHVSETRFCLKLMAFWPTLGAAGTLFKRPSDVCHFRGDSQPFPPIFQWFACVLLFKIVNLFGRLWVRCRNTFQALGTETPKGIFRIFRHFCTLFSKTDGAFLTSVLISPSPAQKQKTLACRTQTSYIERPELRLFRISFSRWHILLFVEQQIPSNWRKRLSLPMNLFPRGIRLEFKKWNACTVCALDKPDPSRGRSRS